MIIICLHCLRGRWNQKVHFHSFFLQYRCYFESWYSATRMVGEKIDDGNKYDVFNLLEKENFPLVNCSPSPRIVSSNILLPMKTSRNICQWNNGQNKMNGYTIFDALLCKAIHFCKEEKKEQNLSTFSWSFISVCFIPL